MTRLFASISWFALAVAASGCGPSGSGAAFDTKLANDFRPAHHAVSVLGVYKDGRMALGTWESLMPYFAPALGPTTCAAGYDAFVNANQDLANAIDAYARDEGPSGKLLAQLAPAAQGDLILVVTYAGQIPAKMTEDPRAQAAPVNNNMGTSRHHRHSSDARNGARTDDQLDISASLFSVAQNRPVAIVSMAYHGDTVKDAMTRFGAEVARTLPDLKCAGWDLATKIDPSKVRPTFDVPTEGGEPH